MLSSGQEAPFLQVSPLRGLPGTPMGEPTCSCLVFFTQVPSFPKSFVFCLKTQDPRWWWRMLAGNTVMKMNLQIEASGLHMKDSFRALELIMRLLLRGAESIVIFLTCIWRARWWKPILRRYFSVVPGEGSRNKPWCISPLLMASHVHFLIKRFSLKNQNGVGMPSKARKERRKQARWARRGVSGVLWRETGGRMQERGDAKLRNQEVRKSTNQRLGYLAASKGQNSHGRTVPQVVPPPLERFSPPKHCSCTPGLRVLAANLSQTNVSPSPPPSFQQALCCNSTRHERTQDKSLLSGPASVFLPFPQMTSQVNVYHPSDSRKIQA